jgi:hypothetical protein
MAAQPGATAAQWDFTWQEGALLAGLELLLGRRRGVPEGVASAPIDPRPEVLRAGADRMARAALGWLFAEGGARARYVVRRGREGVGAAVDAGGGCAPALRGVEP